MNTVDDWKAALPLLEQMSEATDYLSDSVWDLRVLKDRVKAAYRQADKISRWGICCKEDGNIEYGCRIGYYDHISNHGDIDREELLNISFPTGPFIFGDRYDCEYFTQFYNELKEVPPKYVDDLNKSLYYSIDNGEEAWTHYRETYEKYMAGNKQRNKEWLIKQKQMELEALLKQK